MNKAQLVDHLAEQTGMTKADTERIINTAIDTIKTRVKSSEDVTLVGFGTFTRSKRKARRGRNPRTGELIEVPASVVPRFKPGKAFKEHLN